jgi:hypothetical protein
MKGLFGIVGVFLLAGAVTPAASQTSDALRQMDGLWTIKWDSGGKSHIAQVVFRSDPADSAKRIASFPFIPGQVRIFSCSGLGCSGADIVVSGAAFDCLYSHSIYDKYNFAWTFRGGQNTGVCPQDADFRHDPALDNK